MKKLFTEPEVEIISFICNELAGPDSVTVGGDDGTGEPGGDIFGN